MIAATVESHPVPGPREGLRCLSSVLQEVLRERFLLLDATTTKRQHGATREHHPFSQNSLACHSRGRNRGARNRQIRPSYSVLRHGFSGGCQRPARQAMTPERLRSARRNRRAFLSPIPKSSDNTTCACPPRCRRPRPW